MDALKSSEKIATTPEFLFGGGEMGQRIREFDWPRTTLGPVETWPQSLRTCVRIMLTSRQPIWIGWGKDLIKLYNDPYKAIVGGKHPWALGKAASIVWKDIWRDIEPMLRQVMEQDEGTYVESQLLIMERNGYPEETYYTFSYTPIPGDHGGTEGMICANTDDTDRIISERQLLTLTRLGKNLTDSKTNGDVIRTTIGTLKENPYDFPLACFYTLEGDRAFLTDCTAAAEPGISLPKEISLDGIDHVGMLMHQALTRKQSLVLEDAGIYLGQLPQGAWSIPPTAVIIMPIVQSGIKEPYGLLLIGLNPYRLPDEKYRGFFSLLADQVTTRFGNVNILEEERKRTQALAEIDQAKTIFFSNISHEFRTPLTLLLGPIEDTMNDPGTTGTNRVRMDVAYRNALRMQKLVNTLLDFSRIEAGRADGRFSPVDIAAFTAELASSFRSAIERAGMQLYINLGPVSPEVYVDPGMWEKIVLNLVSNAFKYTSEGSITLDIEELNGEVRVSVADTGIGIPEDQLDKIFDRFHRVGKNAVRSQEGTGIGLSLVRELVRIHQGRIEVRSVPGKGSIFIVAIPTGKDHLPVDRIATEAEYNPGSGERSIYVEESLKWLPASETSPAPEPGAPVSGKFRVLLADDNSDMRDYVGRLLAGQYELMTARDGEDAFEKMLSFRPDLLLTDLMMPRLDGFGLLRRIRSHAEIKTTPVIFLSARAGEESKVEGLEAGADDYLVKPFSARELIARVDANIRINSARRLVEQELAAFLLQAPFAIVILSGPGYIIDLANDKYLPIIRQKKEDAIGRPIFDIVPEARDQGYKRLLDNIRETGMPAFQNEQETFLIRDGKRETFYFTIAYQPLKKLTGEVDRIMIVVQDVTERVLARRRVEQHANILGREVARRTKELYRLNLSLQQSNEDLRQFAHVASHDLREPVRKVKVYTGRLQEDLATVFSEKARLYLEKINSAANRMTSMIEGVLHYSSVNSTEEQTEPVDLNRLLKTIESDLELPMQQKKASLTYSGLPVIEGAPVLFYQLFYNLINNSLKFSRKDIPSAITISSEIRNDQAVITIADNGIGFDPDQAERIFDTFSRLNSKDRYEGTGLGLSLCRKIVQRHGGEIGADGKKGEGAVFRIRLPLSPGKENKIQTSL